MKFSRSFFIFVAYIFITFHTCYAISVESPTENLPGGGDGSAETVIPNIIAYFVNLTAILAILAITWGAIQMVLASGEEEKLKKSRTIIIYAFVGLLVSGMAYSIVKLVTNLQL